MNNRKSTWLAWGLCAVTLVFLLLNLPGLPLGPDLSADFGTNINEILTIGYVSIFSIVGALIVANQPRNTIGWLLMSVGITSAVLSFVPVTERVAVLLQQGQISGGLAALYAWVNGWSWWFLMGPLFLILLLFPTGRPLSSRWRWVIALLALTILYFMIGVGLSSELGATESNVAIPNPIGFLSADDLNTLLVPFFGLLIGTTLLSVISVVLRYRRGNAIERQQLKWFLYTCALFLIVYISQIASNFSETDIGALAFDVVIIAIPISIGIAILRYRLFDIDVIIRRTLTYALVTALLAVTFFGSVILLQQLFSGIFGQAQNELVTVLSTLAIAALFVPVRSRIQSEIDKRFNRKKYNTQQVLNDFGKTVRDETDLEKLTGRLMQVVDETMQPKSVSVWLKRDKLSK